MKIIFSLILSILALSSQAQETKKVTEKHKAPTYVEEFYVLKSDKSIRHGEYKKIDYSGKIVAHGYYKNNEKDSVWTYSFWNTSIVSSEGKYEHDKKTGVWIEYYRSEGSIKVKNKGAYEAGSKVGIWEYYNPSSEIIQKFDYTNNIIVEFMNNNEEFEVQLESGIILTKVERPPLYIGGEQNIFVETNFQINYPQVAIEDGISGTVLVSFFVDSDGNASDYKIEKSIGGGCDEEAVRFAKAIPNHWIPALLDGKPVKARYTVPVTFNLSYY